ncbi:right-handed parallel beta-helix repeat-containing protein [Actinomadura logoneensis]|uniref:Right-handed parallel beta-helix repeat-containing protein n=1 Tax=Actinomadura logoneensis TaxID=2293572 RepID=A0A372JSP1_9ACTN|nr:right-handed parallel beta-helix repeat-containing protein [Actinomadura logoneensis]
MPTPSSGTSSASTPPSPAPLPSQPATPDGTPTRDAGKGRCPAYPTPDCTGAPHTLAAPRKVRLNVDNDALLVDKPGTVLEGVHVPGNLVIAADDVTIRNSVIDGRVTNDYKDANHPFTITDSTVGRPDRCVSEDAVGTARYRASGLLVRGFSHGFKVSGDAAKGGDVEITDSYVKNCSNGADHADGIQVWGVRDARHLVVRHNTFDQRGVSDFTAPLFLADSAGGTISDVTVENNLVAGGTYSIQLKHVAGRLVVRDNRMVDRSWSYAPVESWCHAIQTWTGNTVVTVDAAYRITRTVRPLPCAE